MHYIFVHGLGQEASSWNSTINSLKLNSNITSCPNLFSLLGTSEPTYQNLYRLFYEYCEGIKEPIHLCGISLGAILSLNYAIDRPDRVDSLVLIGAQYKSPKLLLNFQNVIFYVMPASVFSKVGSDKETFIKLTGSMKELNFTHELANIQCDTLVICGEKDFANKRASKYLSNHIKNANSVMIQDAGHELNKEHSAKLSAILDDFWDGNRLLSL
ncbi:alpha/beta hydrolase [Salicibibacter cibi]|uniref:Alpha/beta hydrolase n=1 Tax=Salicibibacter cibi TaxID=2743001 RepID=A0A7T6ZAR2_9BACI|nr:alpha/beta hydrolase [Salicibibacter cibi]QQK80053.1 alpha/beta hydrolase [Salicibibacter cibi]